LKGSWSGGEGHSITATHGSSSVNMVGQMVFEYNGPGSRIKWGRLYHSGDQSTYPMHLISDGSSAYLEMNTGSMRAPIFYDYNNTSYYIDAASTSNINAMNTAGTVRVQNLKFNGEGGNSGNGTEAYAIFQESGAWSNPFPDLRIAFHTGIKFGAYNGYEGMRFYTDYDMSSLLFQVNGSSNYLFKYQWLYTNTTGIYSDSHGCHIYPNDGSTHTQWRISGSKNSYGGIWDAYSAVNGIMYDSGGNGGVYREANGRWYLYHHVGNNCMGVGTSTTSSSYGIYANKAIYSEGNIIAYSDIRKKENIVTVDNALDKVNKLRGVFYNRTNDEKKTKQ
ncbi:MAG: tail fiber domain-containing protein, partial [Gammaproteobacteria bacterium]|nr:tail fiber domain-containing protein [Gammaproteobacteria bacterium]